MAGRESLGTVAHGHEGDGLGLDPVRSDLGPGLGQLLDLGSQIFGSFGLGQQNLGLFGPKRNFTQRDDLGLGPDLVLPLCLDQFDRVIRGRVRDRLGMNRLLFHRGVQDQGGKRSRLGNNTKRGRQQKPVGIQVTA
jgi:hypothetical protein